MNIISLRSDESHERSMAAYSLPEDSPEIDAISAAEFDISFLGDAGDALETYLLRNRSLCSLALKGALLVIDHEIKQRRLCLQRVTAREVLQ